jgi:hypothetical protein
MVDARIDCIGRVRALYKAMIKKKPAVMAIWFFVM